MPGVFNAAMGNGDAHLKNWMLRYADGFTAALAPAFDLVSTIQYEKTDQHEFALNFAGVKRYDQLTLSTVERFAAALKVPGREALDPVPLVELAHDTARQVVQQWGAFAEQHDVPPSFTDRLREHWKRLPLLQDR